MTMDEHVEMAIVAASAAERLADYGDCKELSDAYRRVSLKHREAAVRIGSKTPATPEFAINRCRAVLALHKELGPAAEALAKRLGEHGDDDLSSEYRSLAEKHRRGISTIDRILDEQGNLR